MAKGMASIGVVELGASFGEPGVGVVGVVAAEGMVVEYGVRKDLPCWQHHHEPRV